MDAAAWSALILGVIGSLGTLALAILKLVLDYKREGRDRKWKLEQVLVAAELKAQTIQVASELKEHTAATEERIVGKIDENTEVNVKALDAANSLSEKIYRVGLQVREPNPQTDRIEAVVKDTNALVHELKP